MSNMNPHTFEFHHKCSPLLASTPAVWCAVGALQMSSLSDRKVDKTKNVLDSDRFFWSTNGAIRFVSRTEFRSARPIHRICDYRFLMVFDKATECDDKSAELSGPRPHIFGRGGPSMLITWHYELFECTV